MLLQSFLSSDCLPAFFLQIKITLRALPEGARAMVYLQCHVDTQILRLKMFLLRFHWLLWHIGHQLHWHDLRPCRCCVQRRFPLIETIPLCLCAHSSNTWHSNTQFGFEAFNPYIVCPSMGMWFFRYDACDYFTLHRLVINFCPVDSAKQHNICSEETQLLEGCIQKWRKGGRMFLFLQQGKKHMFPPCTCTTGLLSLLVAASSGCFSYIKSWVEVVMRKTSLAPVSVPWGMRKYSASSRLQPVVPQHSSSFSSSPHFYQGIAPSPADQFSEVCPALGSIPRLLF